MPFQIAPVKFRKKKIAPIKTKEKRHLTTRISVLPHSYNSIWWVNVTIPSKQKSNNLFFLYRLKNYTGHVCKSPHYIIPTKGIKKNLWTALLTNNPFTAGQHVVTQIVLPTWTKQENSPIFLNDAYWHSECSRLSSKCTLGVGDIQNVADSHQNAHSKSLRSESQRQNSSSFHQPASSSKTWKNCRTVPWRQLKTNRGAWGYPDLQDQAWLLQYYYSTLDNSPLHKRLTPSDEDSWQNW